MNTSPMLERKTMLLKQVIHTDFWARSGFPAPRFCPTRVAAALLTPQAGSRANMMRRMAIVYPATAAPPKRAMMRKIPIQLEVPIRNCSMPTPEIRSRRFIVARSTFRQLRSTLIAPLGPTRRANWYATPPALPTQVATAAPVRPISGKTHQPKIRIGSRTILIRLASHSDLMAMAASPAPLKIALIRNRRTTVMLKPSMIVVNGSPCSMAASDIPI